MKYEKPQITALPDAVTSVLANPLMKREQPCDSLGSQITVAAYSSDG
jgi:hypothetical protein